MSNDRYNIVARYLHWLMAIGFIFMWACGYSMKSLVADDSFLEDLLFSLHISVGVTLLFLLAVRIIVRLFFRPPPLPDGLSAFEKRGSHIGHLCLYLLPALIIGIGWAETDFGGHGVHWFGVSMPKLFPTMETLFGLNLEETLATLHEWLAYTMLGIALIHVLAVVKHRWVDGHDVLYRMTIDFRQRN